MAEEDTRNGRGWSSGSEVKLGSGDKKKGSTAAVLNDVRDHRLIRARWVRLWPVSKRD